MPVRTNFALALLLISLSVELFASERHTRLHFFQTDARYDYRIELLELALSHTQQQWGSYELIGKPQAMTQGRGSLLLEHDKGIDIASFATNKEREEKFRAIRIPILQGILGYRVLLVHRDSQQAFGDINNLSQLKTQLKAGFGEHWADMKILEANSLAVTGVPKYELLFAMLQAKRFDYFPRGINEAWIEVEKFGSDYPDIMVEPNLALFYPFYVYFFVSKNNQALAERIEQGLMLAKEDGSFKALFLKYHQHLLTQASFGSRKLFFLENPYLPSTVVPPDLSWWLPENTIHQ